MRFTIILRGTSCQQCQGLQWTGSYCFISSQREDSRVSFPTDRLLLHIMFSILAWPLHSWDYCELLLANFTGCSLDKDMAPQPFRVFQFALTGSFSFFKRYGPYGLGSHFYGFFCFLSRQGHCFAEPGGKRIVIGSRSHWSMCGGR